MRTDDQSRQLFDAWAQTYADDVDSIGGPLTGYTRSLHMAAAMIPLTGEQPRVLDIGIGTGGFADLLYQRGAHITGVDFSPVMLEKCAELHPDFELHQSRFLPLPFEDDRFDVVISSFTFHEVPPRLRQQALQEVARVLKLGGVFSMLDIIFASETANQRAKEEIGRAWDDTEVYAHVADLDAMLFAAGFRPTVWMQTGPYHWAFCANLTSTEQQESN
ncbi:MAG: methyltransferase domain-containing protein [Anaerolineaceae bacterium]|nr:methyltransferase domain-containing protein [Anaerolineaceae bacterium]